MKKKILILSLVANFIAVAFILYAFTPKAKNVNDGGGSKFIILRIFENQGSNLSELSISDGSTVLFTEDLKLNTSTEKINGNNLIIVKKMNDLKDQGYDLVSSNSGGYGGGINKLCFC